MNTLAIIVPVLRRPHRVAPLVESLTGSVFAEVLAGWDVRLTFVCSRIDRAEVQAVRDAGLEPLVANWNPTLPGDYARKINRASQQTDADWLFTGADDLLFHPGWLTAAMSVHEQTGALVVGTNDLGNSAVLAGRHATHSLVHRSYLDRAVVDAPGKLLCERYDHNCVDVELVETAQANGVWAFARESHVEHQHWLWRKAERDHTYRKGIRRASADRKLLAVRRKLWTPERAMAV